MDKDVFAVEKNIRGAWVIYGALGVRQYYGHTKLQSIAKYRQECREKIATEKISQCNKKRRIAPSFK